MEIVYAAISAGIGGFLFYIGVQVGYKLSQKQEPKVEPMKAVSKAVQAIQPKKDKEVDPWEVGMKNILNYDGYKEK